MRISYIHNYGLQSHVSDGDKMASGLDLGRHPYAVLWKDVSGICARKRLHQTRRYREGRKLIDSVTPLPLIHMH